MKNKDNTRKEQMEGKQEAMSQIIVQQEDERQLDTIRMRVIEQSNWRQGRKKACRTRSEGSGECWNVMCRRAQRCTKEWELSC